MKIIDTHTHLYLNQFKDDIDKVIQRSIDKGINKFKIDSKENKIKASSATSNMEDTRLSKNNTIEIRKWRSTINLVSIDMTHINRVLSEKETESVDGIIGADVLKKSKAVIDYESNKLYLKIKI